ncbi:hypothetical protein [Deinococcus sp. QL22]|uniref:hypothetical protein n=1 Tax=Deinococcus sp. QL22 TaxID=2939437 RepID=UPI002016E6CE|nr:hypothetical protein [Deinococcus sp. QL22]UQN07344.1 hypothetical protein M1R55_05445 [Deinococcus sp. QL22]
MLKALAQDLSSGQGADLLRAARRAYTLAFVTVAAPGLPLGALYLLTRPMPTPPAGIVGLVVVALALACAALYLARRAARDPLLPPRRTALSAAMQAGTAPAVPFLLGCATFSQPAVTGGLWMLAAVLYALAWRLIAGWMRPAGVGKANSGP